MTKLQRLEENVYWAAQRHYRAAWLEGSKPMTPVALVDEHTMFDWDGDEDDLSTRTRNRLVKAAPRAKYEYHRLPRN